MDLLSEKNELAGSGALSGGFRPPHYREKEPMTYCDFVEKRLINYR